MMYTIESYYNTENPHNPVVHYFTCLDTTLTYTTLTYTVATPHAVSSNLGMGAHNLDVKIHQCNVQFMIHTLKRVFVYQE